MNVTTTTQSQQVPVLALCVDGKLADPKGQVAEFLNVAKELVLEVREWASVLWVKVQGMRPRFVSKKVVKIMAKTSSEIIETLQSKGIRFTVQDSSSWNEVYDKRIVINSEVSITVSDSESHSYRQSVPKSVVESLGFEKDSDSSRWFAFFKNESQIPMSQAWGEYDANLP